jgi:hypothetical protein
MPSVAVHYERSDLVTEVRSALERMAPDGRVVRLA